MQRYRSFDDMSRTERFEEENVGTLTRYTKASTTWTTLGTRLRKVLIKSMSHGKLHGNVNSAATARLAIGKSGVAVERIDQESGKEVWRGDR